MLLPLPVHEAAVIGSRRPLPWCGGSCLKAACLQGASLQGAAATSSGEREVEAEMEAVNLAMAGAQVGRKGRNGGPDGWGAAWLCCLGPCSLRGSLHRRAKRQTALHCSC